MTDESNNTASPSSIDTDLYCLNCGYNLRGLSGDPRHCPECGHLNPMGDLQLPASLIHDQLQRMESAPTYCVILFSINLTITSIFIYCLRDGVHSDLEIVFNFLYVIFQIPLIGMWCFYVISFKNACQGKQGWLSLLAKYHISGSLLVALVLGIQVPLVIIDIQKSTFGTRGGTSNDLTGYIEAFIIFALTAFVIIVPGTRIRNKLKKDMDLLQREVAVILARDKLHRDLHDEK